MQNDMISQLDKIRERYDEINALLADPEVIADRKRFQDLSREHSRVSRGVELLNRFRKMADDLRQAKELVKSGSTDAEMRELAEMEIGELETGLEQLNGEIRFFLVPPDPDSGKNIMMEIRAGTGGDESALFAADLFRMYTRFAENRKLRVEIITSHETGLGGFKEIIFSVEGDDAYDLLRYEMGTHRVQRVPETESGGRIHTSAVTVAVLPEVEESEVQIDEKDLRIDVFRSSGPGGQSVNTTDSAVRITHIPSGLVVTCQDEKSQHKNKAKAMKVLRARLYEQIEQERLAQISETRRSQVGSGDRSGRIRTYNFPENRVTDHRIKLTLHKLDAVLEGELDLLISELDKARREEILQEMSAGSGV